MKFKLSLHQIRVAILTIALILLAGGAGFWLGQHDLGVDFRTPASFFLSKTQPVDKQDVDFSLFWEVWDRLGASYLDKAALVSQEMVYGAIKGMVAALDDPYTVFLKPEENQQAKEDLNGSFGGVGIQLGFKDKDQLVVIAPLEGMPAEKVGVRAGDLILKVEDQETIGMALPEAVRLIRGPTGTKIQLTLLHEDEEEPYEVTITRDIIVVPSVEVSLLDGRCVQEKGPCLVAHLKLTKFGERTRDEWLKAVDRILKEPSVRGVILDLRNNPGGFLDGSVFIASEFLKSGVVVRQEMADGSKDSFEVNRQGRVLTQPLVVLVNRGSASASEIVAGALKEGRRAKVVGEKTFGKGTIQEAQDLPKGAGLHITTARWLLSSGASLDKKGVTPDFEVADDPATEELDEPLQKAIEVLENL